MRDETTICVVFDVVNIMGWNIIITNSHYALSFPTPLRWMSMNNPQCSYDTGTCISSVSTFL